MVTPGLTRLLGIAIVFACFLVAPLSQGMAAKGPATVDGMVKDFPPINSSNVRRLLTAMQTLAATDAQLDGFLGRVRRNIHIVFIPGILGSAIKVNGEPAWGYGLPNSDKLQRLSLPERLVDPAADAPEVSVEIIRELLGSDVYGEAIDALKATTRSLGVSFRVCPYDWRRDIRYAARYLEETCLQDISGQKDDPPASIILVAHSMGGVVATQWHNAFYRNYSAGEKQQRQLEGMVMLGSPLLGSCEVLRMIRKGFQNPVSSWTKEPGDLGGRFWDYLSELKNKKLINPASRAFTNQVRPLILTWPGALELTPRHSTSQPNHCAPLLRRQNQQFEVHSYYEPSFWDTNFGHDLRDHNGSPFILPDWIEKILATAREFREQFSTGLFGVPVAIFYSSYWETLTNIRVTPGGNIPANDAYSSADGDGRVTVGSAMGGLEGGTFYGAPLPGVHGSLPSDPFFRKWFDRRRLPEIVNGLMARASAIYLAGGASESILPAYLAAGGADVTIAEIEALLSGWQKSVPSNWWEQMPFPRAVPAWKRAVTALNEFYLQSTQTALLDRTQLTAWRRATPTAITGQSASVVATAYEIQIVRAAETVMDTTPRIAMVMPEGLGAPDSGSSAGPLFKEKDFRFAGIARLNVKAAQDQLQAGLALAGQGKPIIAIRPLIQGLEQMRLAFPTPQKGIAELMRVARRTLALQYYLAGECRAAAPLLRLAEKEAAVLGDASLAAREVMRTLSKPCLDRASYRLLNLRALN